jgi:hypothetical protein
MNKVVLLSDGLVLIREEVPDDNAAQSNAKGEL